MDLQLAWQQEHLRIFLDLRNFSEELNEP